MTASVRCPQRETSRRPDAWDSAPTAITLLRFQRDVTTAALTVNAHQNLVRLIAVHSIWLTLMGISTFRSCRNGALGDPSNRMPL